MMPTTLEPHNTQLRLTAKAVTAATIDRVAAHFSEKVWAQTGLVVLGCEAAGRAGLITRTGDLSVNADEIAANLQREPSAAYEIRKSYARLEVTFGDGQQLLYVVPADRSTAVTAAKLTAEALVWGTSTSAIVLRPDGSHDQLAAPLIPPALLHRITDWKAASSRRTRVRAIEWCPTGPGDFRSWHHQLAEVARAS